MANIFDQFDTKNGAVPTASSSNMFDKFDTRPAPKAPPADAASHPFNPLNPNVVANNKALDKKTGASPTFFDKVASAADDVATGANQVGRFLGLGALEDLPQAAKNYGSDVDAHVSPSDVFGATKTVAKQAASGVVAGPADITIGTYEAATHQSLGPVQTPFGTFQSPQETQNQLRDAGYGPFVSAIGAVGQEGVNFGNMVATAVAVDDIITKVSGAAGSRIATEKLVNKITPDELRTKLANGEITTPAGKALAEKLIAENKALTVDMSKPASELRRLVGEDLLGGTAQKGGTARVDSMGKPMGGNIAEPFANEAAASAPRSIEPFAGEPGRVDGTLEPFTGKLVNQLPDKVVQMVSSKGGSPGVYFTIPISQAHSIIGSIDGSQNGIAGKDVNGQVYHVTAKSPSQMEALGFTNGGSFSETGLNPEAGFIDPGQAFKDIQDTIQKFKDNAENNLAGQRLRTQFVGNKNARIAQTNQMLESLTHIVKDPVQQEALSLARDFASKPEELAQFLYGEHPFYDELTTKFQKDNPTATPAEVAAFRQEAIDNVGKFRKVIEAALNPSESMTEVNKALDTYYTAKLAEGREAGVLDSSIDPKEYIAHILSPKVRKGSGAGKFGGKFVHSLERGFPTQLHAIAYGMMPKTMNAFTQTAIYEDRHATSVATSEFLQQLKTEGLLKFKEADAPKDWESVKVGKKLVFLPKNMADAIKPLLEEGLKPNTLLTGLNNYQATVKAAEVSLSVFHMKALAVTSINADGVPNAVREIMTNMNTPEFKAQEVDFVKHGGTTSILGKTAEAYRLAVKSSVPSTGQMLKTLPVVSQVTSLADKITHATFDVLQREQKVGSYSQKVAAWLGKHPNATPEELYNAKVDIAKVVNSFYGGLNWESLGVSKLGRLIAKVLFFAPDWTYSNILTGKYTFEAGPAGTAARRFWLSSAIFGLVATQMLSLAISGKKSKHPFQVYFGNDNNGKEMYGNWFFVGAPGDLTKWIDNVHQYGAAVGTAKTIGNKFQSVPRALVNLFTNKNYLGQNITVKGANPIVNTARGLLQFGSDTLPIPFSLVDFAQMLQDKKQDYKLWDYLSLIGGSPPSHQVPEGSHVPTTGKNKGKVVPDSEATKNRPQKSLLDQIKTGGSIYEPKTKAQSTKRPSPNRSTKR